MKKHLSIALLVISSVLPSWAYKTTITSTIYADTTGLEMSNSPSGTIPMQMRRVHFINHATSLPELESALTAASGIFTDAMAQENIDLVEIDVEVLLDTIDDEYALCEVDVIYTDTVDVNSSYYQFSLYLNHPRKVLVPMAISNQTRRENCGVAMRIRLRDDISYYCGTGDVPSGQYDAVTILLRALAIGCGIQSTIDASTGNIGIQDGLETYINAFDTQIYNEDLVPLENVIEGNPSFNAFLSGKNVFAIGSVGTWGLDTVHINLFNRWKDQPLGLLTSSTLNSIDIYQYKENLGYGMDDLMATNTSDETCIREITPYTMALLQRLGWMKTIPTGNDPYDKLYESRLLCNGMILNPNVNYTLSIDKQDIYFNNIRCEIDAIDTSYTIGTGIDVIESFSYDNMPTNTPDNVQWRRNPISKNIIGKLKAEAFLFGDPNITQTKVCDIEIPYRPNKPIVQKSETSDSTDINLSLSAFANGSNSYTITYTGLTNSDFHSFTVNADAVDTILSIPATQYYDVSVYGTNTNGNSDSYNFTIGFSIQPQIDLKLVKSGGTLRYYLNSQNATSLPNTQIGDITITNYLGTLTIYPQANPGDAIDISSLPRDIYLFSVEINGNTYSKMFFK